MTELGEGQRCRWCMRPLPDRAPVGRPRVYCRRSCRQRDYEARRRSAELGLGESELVVTRAELEGLRDGMYVLACAIEDVERDLAEATDPNAYQEAVAWLLDAARPLVHRMTVAAEG